MIGRSGYLRFPQPETVFTDKKCLAKVLFPPIIAPSCSRHSREQPLVAKDRH
jgi:hypothetical protein